MLRKLSIILSVLLFLGCSTEKEPQSFSFMGLNTVCTITIYDSSEIDEGEVEKIVSEIENLMSRHISGNELDRINNGESFTISAPLYDVIYSGIEYGILSDGLFNISIGKIIDFWNITERLEPPSKEEIEGFLPLPQPESIILHNDGSVSLESSEVSIDLGGIAKGYAASRVESYLRNMGVKSAIINLGGNISLIGSKLDGSNWRIGIQHPLKDRGDYIGIVEFSDNSLVSSGDYERFFEYNGTTYHHILDSSTGYPLDGAFNGSSIIYPDAMDADALSTITFGSSLEQIKDLRNELKFSGVFAGKDGNVYITEDLKDNFVLTDESYRLITF